MNQITTVGIDLAKRGVAFRYCTAERPLPTQRNRSDSSSVRQDFVVNVTHNQFIA